MVEMGKMATCGGIMAIVGVVVAYIHHYEGNIFSIHICN
jgi:uncharacterized membrane protein